MSAVIERFIICDHCGENFGVDSRSMSISYHRRQAKKEGWTFRNNKDYCEQCSQLVRIANRLK